MTTLHLRGSYPPLAALLIAAVVGLLAVQGDTAAVVGSLLIFAALALALPTIYWISGGLVAALLLPGVQAVGLLPGFATYLHFPIVYAAFGLAVTRATTFTPAAKKTLLAAALLFGACAISTAASGDSVARGAFEFFLIAEPFVFLTAIMLARPDESEWILLKRTVLVLLAIQLPVILFQLASVGLTELVTTHNADRILGTIGVLGGSHILGGMAMVAAFWVVASGVHRRWLYAALLLCVPILAGANQVTYAVPLIIAVSPAASHISKGLRIGVALVVAIALLAVPSLTAGYVVPSINAALSGEGGKNEAASLVWSDIKNSPQSMLVGVGPAETVSGTAFLTTDPLRKPNSPLKNLHLTPSTTVIGLDVIGKPISSFNSPKSSALGILGDLGLAGLAIYLWYFGFLLTSLYRRKSPEGVAAYSGVILMIILGVITDGWEEPQFTIFVTAMVGLALTGPYPRPPLSRRRLDHAA